MPPGPFLNSGHLGTSVQESACLIEHLYQLVLSKAVAMHSLYQLPSLLIMDLLLLNSEIWIRPVCVRLRTGRDDRQLMSSTPDTDSDKIQGIAYSESSAGPFAGDVTGPTENLRFIGT
jgi:hypothetical protein